LARNRAFNRDYSVWIRAMDPGSLLNLSKGAAGMTLQK
jgi:hypothetical protein